MGRQDLIAFMTPEHCEEHVFQRTCEIRLPLATDLNIFRWNSINEAVECCAVARIVCTESGAFCTEEQNGICALYGVVAFHLGFMKYTEGETQRELVEEWCMSLISGR